MLAAERADGWMHECLQGRDETALRIVARAPVGHVATDERLAARRRAASGPARPRRGATPCNNPKTAEPVARPQPALLLSTHHGPGCTTHTNSASAALREFCLRPPSPIILCHGQVHTPSWSHRQSRAANAFDRELVPMLPPVRPDRVARHQRQKRTANRGRRVAALSRRADHGKLRNPRIRARRTNNDHRRTQLYTTNPLCQRLGAITPEDALVPLGIAHQRCGGPGPSRGAHADPLYMSIVHKISCAARRPVKKSASASPDRASYPPRHKCMRSLAYDTPGRQGASESRCRLRDGARRKRRGGRRADGL